MSLTPKINLNDMKRLFVALLCVVLCTSCATILSGTTERVTFDSDYRGSVTMIVDGRRYHNVKFPYKVNVERGFKDSVVRIVAEEHEMVTMYINKRINPWAFLNMLEPVGWLIDAVTGAVTQPDMEYYWVDFEPSDVSPR